MLNKMVAVLMFFLFFYAKVRFTRLNEKSIISALGNYLLLSFFANDKLNIKLF